MKSSPGSATIKMTGLLRHQEKEQKKVKPQNEPPHYKINKMTCAPSEVTDQPRHQPSLISLHCPHEECWGPSLPIECTAKTLIRLGGCSDWSESLFGAQVILLVLPCCGSNTDTRDLGQHSDQLPLPHVRCKKREKKIFKYFKHHVLFAATSPPIRNVFLQGSLVIYLIRWYIQTPKMVTNYHSRLKADISAQDDISSRNYLHLIYTEIYANECTENWD